MKLMYFTDKEEVQKQWVLLENIQTGLMIADMWTKVLQPKTFTEHVQRMNVGCTYDWYTYDVLHFELNCGFLIYINEHLVAHNGVRIIV